MKVANHHNIVQNKEMRNGNVVLMTVAVGSQNYGLDTPKSDCDTFSFILPDFLSFIRGDTLKSYEFEVEDGKCMVKDMRLALNLLRKPSPNSIEWFLSDYQYYEPIYAPVFRKYLNDGYYRRMIIHCDYKNMINAIIGTATGLHGRNMTSGKKYSHIIRLINLASKYIASIETSRYFLLPKQDREIALLAKTTPAEYSFQENIDAGIQELKNIFQYFRYSETFQDDEKLAQYIVNNFQTELFNIYLKENGYEKKN